jgi:hypothetical protein
MSVFVAGVDEIYIVYWLDTDHKQRRLRSDQMIINDNKDLLVHETIRLLLIYSETSLNWTLRKPVLPEYRPIF